jgi:hypothetical protein
VHPTGPDHWEGQPGWATGDRYADEKLLVAGDVLAAARRRIARNVLLAYDLLNEPSAGHAAIAEKWNRWLKQRTARPTPADAWGVAAERIHWGDEPAPAIGPTQSKLRRTGNAVLPQSRLDYQHFRENRRRLDAASTQAIKASDPGALVTVGMIQWSVPALLPACNTTRRSARAAGEVADLSRSISTARRRLYAYRNDDEKRQPGLSESVVREAAAGPARRPGGIRLVQRRAAHDRRRVHPPADEASRALVPQRDRNHLGIGDRLAQLGLLRSPSGP